MSGVDVVEAGIADLRSALESGRTTSEALVRAFLARIEAYDRRGPRLNSVPVPNPAAIEEARAADRRRAEGRVLGPLDGIPYTAKDSYSVRGLPVAAGSPAFEHLVAGRDAFVIERLRAGGAVLLGLTTMPPMANGGMQRGVHGRAESPYAAGFLTAAFASGSSNGSGTATAASFAAFGLAEETWSSGRSPASNNALCAYTPSRGVISVRGNWPLVPTMDVVVPHARTMADLLEVLDVVVADDADPRGDFWRVQPWIDVPAASAVRPHDYRRLAPPDPEAARAVLAGARLAAPGMYIGEDDAAGTGVAGGIGGPTGRRIAPRPSVLALWAAARADLAAAGADVRTTGFPAVTNYEGDRAGASTIRTRGLVSPAFLDLELFELTAWAWDDFLDANGDPALRSLADVDGARIVPPDPGALPDRYDGFLNRIAEMPELVRRHGRGPLTDLPGIEEGLRGLDATRAADVDAWLDDLGAEAAVFPAAADVAPADADVDPASADVAWRNGVWVSNANLVPRHLGLPTVTVPMGTMVDTGMPVGLTFLGRPYGDTRLLELAAAFEALRPRRTTPPRTPPLP